MGSCVLVTGGAGFIGSNFVRHIAGGQSEILVLDNLTYAGFLPNIEDLIGSGRVVFQKGSIGDFDLVRDILSKHRVTHIVNFAAESHVDNSINGPEVFVQTNVVGTFKLLEAARHYYCGLSDELRSGFRIVHVSTDEVFGELGNTGRFSERSPYAPSSPYSATKAASDHLVRAWSKTYGMPTIVTNCSNNYGPRQFPEKLIPRMIFCALKGQPLPVYGRGENVRDWIHVVDHCQGVLLALERGTPGETYCFGGNSERRNIDVVYSICGLLDELRPRSTGESYQKLISFVEDRLGHDWRYAIDDSFSQRQLGFERRFANFEDGLRDTIQWYLDNLPWLEAVQMKRGGS